VDFHLTLDALAIIAGLIGSWLLGYSAGSAAWRTKYNELKMLSGKLAVAVEEYMAKEKK